MWPDTLGLVPWKRSRVRVFDDLKLVLLVLVEEAVKGCCGKAKSFSDQRREFTRDGRHLGDVGFIGWAERGERVGVGPLIWSEEIVVERIGRFRKRVRG